MATSLGLAREQVSAIQCVFEFAKNYLSATTLKQHGDIIGAGLRTSKCHTICLRVC
jgi:hypothetical protein